MLLDTKPLVSVIIPTYCRPKLFEIALNSVLNQTYKNIEIFITDNSPDDRTKVLMEDYLKRFDNIIYEHHPEYTSADENWHRAMEYNNPEAEYVNWLMDDDVFLPRKIEIMLKVFEEYPELAMVTSYRQCIDLAGNPLPDFKSTAVACTKDSYIKGETAGRSILTGLWNFVGEPTTPLVRKSSMLGGTLGSATGVQNYFMADFPTWLHCFTQGGLVYLIDPLSQFRIHSGQDQYNINMMMTGLIRWGLEILFYWNKKVFLSNSQDFEWAYKGWLMMQANVIEAAERKDYDNIAALEKCIEIANNLETIYLSCNVRENLES